MRARIGLLVLVTACQVGGGSGALEPGDTSATATTIPAPTAVPSTPAPTTAPAPSTTTEPAASTTISTTTTLPPGVRQAPAWLGTRPLPVGDDGEVVPVTTPPELIDRRFVTPDHLPPPPDGAYHSSVGPVPARVAARSTWTEECPVALEDLAYVTVTFRGFDGLSHTGELLVAETVADDVVTAFRRLYEADFPIEEMRITTADDLEAEPTGDGNVTSSFVCRPVTGGTGWSEHAHGLAIDINPFHNPYVRGDTVLPELATAYADRTGRLAGTIHEGDAVTRAFDSIGWAWGGRWSSLKDYQHFSLRGR